MAQQRSIPALLLLATTLLIVPGCKSKPPQTEPEPPPPAVEERTPPEATTPPPVEVREEPFRTETPRVEDVRSSPEELARSLETIYFAFDAYDLDESARRKIRENSEWLTREDYRRYRLVIEGHCDERGTIEYNLSLGERRAKAVRDYMVQLGVEPSRLRIITFGEERPADPRHSETAWTKNRRAEFEVEQ